MVNLKERMMILELHQQGLSVSAIAAKGLVAFLLAFSQAALFAACIGNARRNLTLATGQTDRCFDWRPGRLPITHRLTTE